jgi:hypothetical protein
MLSHHLVISSSRAEEVFRHNMRIGFTSSPSPSSALYSTIQGLRILSMFTALRRTTQQLSHLNLNFSRTDPASLVSPATRRLSSNMSVRRPFFPFSSHSVAPGPSFSPHPISQSFFQLNSTFFIFPFRSHFLLCPRFHLHLYPPLLTFLSTH